VVGPFFYCGATLCFLAWSPCWLALRFVVCTVARVMCLCGVLLGYCLDVVLWFAVFFGGGGVVNCFGVGGIHKG